MKDRKLATRYARALLAALPDPARAEAADAFLTALAGAVERFEELDETLLDPAVPRASKLGVLTSLAEAHGAPAEIATFLATVVDHGRVAQIPVIAAVYHELREAEQGIVPATMTTAGPLTPELETRARHALERLTGRTVRLRCEVEPGLIGGAVTRVGSTVYDGSLRTQLDLLRKKMVEE